MAASTERVVVIGGGGFIGKRVVSRLREQGHPVTVVSRTAAARSSSDPGLTYEAGDVADAARMKEVIAGAAVVYDLSMGGGTTWADYEREVIGGARNVARACLQGGARRMIYTSSIAALYLGGSGAMQEAAGNDGDSADRGMYSRGKSFAERALLELHAAEKLPAVILRPGVVLGPGGKLVHGALGESFGDSDLSILGAGNGRHPLPCVLVDDVADALIRAKDTPGIEGATFNLAGDIRPTAREMVDYLRERTMRNFQYHQRSLAWLYCGELLRWSVKKLARKPNPVMQSYRELSSMTMSRQLDCSLAKRLLGWKPVNDRAEFFRQAIDPHVQPVQAGDLRCERA